MHYDRLHELQQSSWLLALREMPRIIDPNTRNATKTYITHTTTTVANERIETDRERERERRVNTLGNNVYSYIGVHITKRLSTPTYSIVSL